MSLDVPLEEGKDFYYEGEFIVFTEDYLRRRGYCCESGCRHCPYGFRKNNMVPDAEPMSGE